MTFEITPLDATTFRDRLPEALRVYVDAMGYSPGVIRNRAPAWIDHSHRAGWSGWAAFAREPKSRSLSRSLLGRTLVGGSGDRLIGICYGYHGAPGQWWYDQVSFGMAGDGASIPTDFVELTELHVAPEWQGHGIGRRLLREFLGERPEGTVMLSTPEVPDDANSAWHLYRSEGFRDALRGFRFSGDPRPFAVLTRELPLEAVR